MADHYVFSRSRVCVHVCVCVCVCSAVSYGDIPTVNTGSLSTSVGQDCPAALPCDSSVSKAKRLLHNKRIGTRK